MIRRWSSLNELDFQSVNFPFLRTKYKINIFRSSVSFRRFTYKNSKFKRKILAKWKRKTNRYHFINIFKQWTIDFFFYKNLIKHLYFDNSYPISFFIYNFNFIKLNHLKGTVTTNNAITMFFSQKINYYINKNSEFKSLKLNVNLNIAGSNEINLVQSDNNLQLISLKDNNFFYPIFSPNLLLNFDINNLIFNYFEIILSQIKEYYKIINMLIYFNILKR